MTIETTSRNTVRLEGVQLLRAVAAISVVFYHAVATTENYGLSPDVFPWSFYGAQGVDLFFVISGFIIYYTIESGNLSSKTFVRRRLERLIPLYWTFTFAVFVVGIIFSGSFASGGADEWMTPANLAASIAFLSVPTSSQTIVFVGWTLEFEMLFYLCVAALIPLRSRWSAISILFCVAVVAGRVLEDLPPALGFLTSPLLLEFIMGVAVAECLLKRKLKVLTVLPLLIALIFCIPTFGDVWRVFAGGITSAIILLFVAKADLGRRASGGRWTRTLMLLGDASYSIYLVQVLTIAAGVKITLAVLPPFPLPLLVFVVTVATVIAGVLLFLLVERPIMNHFRARRRLTKSGGASQTS